MSETTKSLDEIFEENRINAAEAIKQMGGQADAARKLTERLRQRGITDKTVAPGTVWAWLNRDKCGVPLSYLEDVEAESGVSRIKLRADIPWPDCAK